MQLLKTENLKQIGLISLIVILGLKILTEFTTFIPGVLAAATMYILLRNYYLLLIEKKKWKPWVAATVFIVGAIIVVVIPSFFIFQAIIPKANVLLGQADQVAPMLKQLTANLNQYGIPVRLDTEQINGLIK